MPPPSANFSRLRSSATVAGKFAHGEVRLFLGSQHLFHFFLAEAAGGGNPELAAGEVRQEVVRGVEVAVGMQFFHLIQ